ncbi:hypothetical protein BCA37_10585 [Mycobacterium sp. djl-10]|nr:hypothetical protein BCA37_10585 [Mycobacterium sp. djl-10]
MSDIVERARHEISEDRRIAELANQQHTKDALLRRAAVTEELVAEVEQLRRGGQTLGELLHRINQDVLDATNSHDLIGEDGDGDWMCVYERLAELKPQRIETAEDLDRVSTGSVVRSKAGTIACRFDALHGVVFGDDRPFQWRKLALPAQLIWENR